MRKIIFHIDVNSAYLSWTAVVLAKSPLAKKYGIRTGEPVVNAFRKCPNLIMKAPDHKMYREKSRRLMEYLRTFTEEIEQVSVDECYMDFTEIADRFPSPQEGAECIRKGVKKQFGFTVNIGTWGHFRSVSCIWQEDPVGKY